MRESTVIQGWIDRGILEGKVETFRSSLRMVLAHRFPEVPAEVLQRIDETTDLETLDRAFQQSLNVARSEGLFA